MWSTSKTKGCRSEVRSIDQLVPVCGACGGPIAEKRGPTWLRGRFLSGLKLLLGVLLLAILLAPLGIEGARVWTTLEHKPLLDNAAVPIGVQRRLARTGQISEVELASLSAAQQLTVHEYLEDLHAIAREDDRLSDHRERVSGAEPAGRKRDHKVRQQGPAGVLNHQRGGSPFLEGRTFATVGLVPESPVWWLALGLAGLALLYVLDWLGRIRAYVCGAWA